MLVGAVMVVEEMEVPSETVLDVLDTEYHSLDQTEFMKTRPTSELASQNLFCGRETRVLDVGNC